MATDTAALLSTLEQLRSLPREATTVEFKSNLVEPEEIGAYISALANSAILERHDRAWVVWGVEDTTHLVKGTTFNPFGTKGEGNQSLVMWLTHKITPRPDFEFHTVTHPAGSVVMLEIRPPRTAPLAFKGIAPEAAKRLKAEKLIEGRFPNYFISSKVAEWTNQKARYIHNRALDDDFYRRLIVEYLQQYKRASRKELDELLLAKLSEVLTADQKQHKVKNLLQSLRRKGTVRNAGSNKAPTWVLADGTLISNLSAKKVD